jgi:hypothetical protein
MQEQKFMMILSIINQHLDIKVFSGKPNQKYEVFGMTGTMSTERELPPRVHRVGAYKMLCVGACKMLCLDAREVTGVRVGEWWIHFFFRK